MVHERPASRLAAIAKPVQTPPEPLAAVSQTNVVKPGATPSTTATKPLAPARGLVPSNIDGSFDQIDVNHDGVLTQAEIKLYVAKQPRKKLMTIASRKR